MLEAVIDAPTAPCPKCQANMVVAAITPHPVAHDLARYSYFCAACNQTTPYILPVAPSAETEAVREPEHDGPRERLVERRAEPREALATPASIYDKDGSFLVPCTLCDLSESGGRLELFKETALPQYFLLSLLPDGSGQRLCSKVWQIALIAGVRFVENEAG